MTLHRLRAIGIVCALALTLSGCSNGFGSLGNFGSKLFGGGQTPVIAATEDVFLENATAGTPPPARVLTAAAPARRGFFGRKVDDPNTSVQVNKYLWSASLDVLNFLPLQSADPFTGVIVTGFGTPPGGGRVYRATVFVSDSALDAGSLNVSLNTRGGPASAATIRALEDAILTRARQLRIGGS